MAKKKLHKNNHQSSTVIDVDHDFSNTGVSDLNSPISEIFRHQVSKHRSCWRHVFASLIIKKKRVTLGDIEVLIKRSPCLLEFPCHFYRGERMKRKGKREATKEQRLCKDAKIVVPREKQKLDSISFECYFQNLWKNLSEAKRTSFAYFDCMWFALYLQESYKAKVLSWIKKKHIFSKKYVIVPMFCWGHWNLLIFCHFGESVQSETQKPCMLLLDSLQSADTGRYEADIRKFVLDIFREVGRPEQKDLIYQIPLFVPKVPQQRNEVECGDYVLYFIKLFMEGAPENFSIKGGYPYFMKKNWFTAKDLDCFCQKLYSSAK